VSVSTVDPVASVRRATVARWSRCSQRGAAVAPVPTISTSACGYFVQAVDDDHCPPAQVQRVERSMSGVSVRATSVRVPVQPAPPWVIDFAIRSPPGA
jgi:hypothetical protein